MIRVLGSWKTDVERWARVSGQWRKVTGIMTRVGGQWRQGTSYAPSFSASAPTQIFGSGGVKPVASKVSTQNVMISVSGGTSPYSYSWNRTSGDSRISAESPSMATTRFSATIYNEDINANFAWSVTDALGKTVTGNIFVDISSSAN